MGDNEETEVSLRRIILIIIVSATISMAGLTIYFLFKDSNPAVAIYGAIIVFAGLMPITLLPRFFLQRYIRRHQ